MLGREPEDPGTRKMRDADYRALSFWHDTLPGSLEPRAPLDADETVDVAIVGAGYTGLWTAYFVTALEPSIRVAIVEAEIAGFGASGRNGGWVAATRACSGSPSRGPKEGRCSHSQIQLEPREAGFRLGS